MPQTKATAKPAEKPPRGKEARMAFYKEMTETLIGLIEHPLTPELIRDKLDDVLLECRNSTDIEVETAPHILRLWLPDALNDLHNQDRKR